MRIICSGRLLAIVLSCILPILPTRVTAQNSQQAPTIRVQVESVFVPVVVRDTNGHVVKDLTKDDFQIFDNGKLISDFGFAIEKRAEIYSTRAADSPHSAAGVLNQSPAKPAPTRFIVFVFDNLHISVDELMRVQKAASKILVAAITETDMAAVISLSGMNSGLTRDTAKLQEAVGKIGVQRALRHDDHACPNIDYYQADLELVTKPPQDPHATPEAEDAPRLVDT